MTIIWCMVPEIPSMTDRILGHFGPFFALSPRNNQKNQKFWWNEKNTNRYYHFIHVSHKWQSYDTRFLRYQVRWTEFFCHLTIFCSFTLLTTLKIKTLRIWNKNPWRYYHFIQVYHKWQWCMVPEMWSVTDRIFCHFGLFFALLPP